MNRRGRRASPKRASTPARPAGRGLADQRRTKYERGLVEAKAFSDAIIQTAHEALLVIDGGFRVVLMNTAFSRLFKIGPGTAGGMMLESVLNLWWSGNELRARLEDTLMRGIPLDNFELEVHPRNLGRRVLRFNARRLQPQGESPPLLLVAIEDITPHVLAKEQLAESNKKLHALNEDLERRVERRTKELRESNKQLEGFCYTIAHDLRGPLRAMAGFGKILLDDFSPTLGDRGTEYIGRIIKASQQMDALIHDLLEYGRINTVELEPAPVETDKVLTRVIDNLDPIIRETRARVVRKGRLPNVLAHSLVLETALSNLLTNALKFVPPETAPQVSIWADERDRQVCIWVADNGIGIDPKYHRKIFEVFERLNTQTVYPGTGIGLAIVQRALHRIGGTVGVESELGKGSRFWMAVPRAVEAAGARAA